MPGSRQGAELKRKAFARIIFEEPQLPRYKAAEKAGYKGNVNTLSTKAAQLVNDGTVLAELAELTRQAKAESLVSYDTVVQALALLAGPHMQTYHRDNGMLKQPHELSEEQSRAIKSWKVMKLRTKPIREETCGGCGQVHPVVDEESVLSIELHDALKLWEMLGKTRHVGAFKEVIEHAGTGSHERWLKERGQIEQLKARIKELEAALEAARANRD